VFNRSSQHLKSRFGGSYSIEVRCTSIDVIPQVQAMIVSLSEHAVLDEQHGASVKYTVPKHSSLSLSTAFRTIEAARQSLGIVQNYSITQTSLEQIFINLAKQQQHTA
jgi:ATP-binding cassette, subfamily A (ABC1), member 4